MRYLDKIMFNKPYPILYDCVGLLYVQIGSALFSLEPNDQSNNSLSDKEEKLGIREIPICIPAGQSSTNPRVLGFNKERFSYFFDLEDKFFLCLQGEKIDLSFISEYFDTLFYSDDRSVMNYLDIHETLLSEGVKISVPREPSIVLTLNFFEKEPHKSWMTKKNKYGICFRSYIVDEDDNDKEDFYEEIADFTCQALGLDVLFEPYGFRPEYQFIAGDGTSDEKVELFNKYFNYFISFSRYSTEVRKAILKLCCKEVSDENNLCINEYFDRLDFTLDDITHNRSHNVITGFKSCLDGLVHFKAFLSQINNMAAVLVKPNDEQYQIVFSNVSTVRETRNIDSKLLKITSRFINDEKY